MLEDVSYDASFLTSVPGASPFGGMEIPGGISYHEPEKCSRFWKSFSEG